MIGTHCLPPASLALHLPHCSLNLRLFPAPGPLSLLLPPPSTAFQPLDVPMESIIPEAPLCLPAACVGWKPAVSSGPGVSPTLQVRGGRSLLCIFCDITPRSDPRAFSEGIDAWSGVTASATGLEGTKCAPCAVPGYSQVHPSMLVHPYSTSPLLFTSQRLP